MESKVKDTFAFQSFCQILTLTPLSKTKRHMDFSS